MKNILILTDFSQCSHNATQYAINFLKNETCCFYVMHVHKSSSFTLDDLMASATANVYESVLKAEKARLQHLKETLEQQAVPNHTFETILAYNSFLDATHNIIEEKQIEIVVAGFNGVSNVSEILFGSHTLTIIRKVHCTTLVVPEAVTFQYPKTMLIPLDATDDIQSDAFTKILNAAKKYDIKTHIVRVYEKGYQGNRYDESFLMKQYKELTYTYHVIEQVPLHYVKSCFMQMYSIDIIGLVVQKESVFERLFTHSSTTEISQNLQKPLWVTHP